MFTAFWDGLSIRWRLLLAVIVLNMAAAAVAAAIIVYNAREATKVEVAASMDMAEGFVRGVVQRHMADGTGENRAGAGDAGGVGALPFRVDSQRHVRIQVLDAHGVPRQTAGDAQAANHPDSGEEATPAWFAALIGAEAETRSVPVVRDGQRLGSVLIAAEASDEIAEVWEDVSDLALLAVGANAAVMLLLYVVLGWLLAPLSAVSQGLREMERGHYQCRLRRPRIAELAAITSRFNALAESLHATRMENISLNKRLVTAQDDERRQIAMELHDELGSCLFGLKANALSLRQLSSTFPEETARPLWERVDTLIDISEDIQVVNRRLLKRIRPMALGHVSLAWALADLVGDFERYAPDIAFFLEIDRIAHGYGDCVDLTVYRCLRESLTNAVRHGAPETVRIHLDERPPEESGGDGGAELAMTILDDGRGLASDIRPGLGLTGIQTRVHALGGRFSISAAPQGGARVEISIPLDEIQRTPPAEPAAGTGDQQKEVSQ